MRAYVLKENWVAVCIFVCAFVHRYVILFITPQLNEKREQHRDVTILDSNMQATT